MLNILMTNKHSVTDLGWVFLYLYSPQNTEGLIQPYPNPISVPRNCSIGQRTGQPGNVQQLEVHQHKVGLGPGIDEALWIHEAVCLFTPDVGRETLRGSLVDSVSGMKIWNVSG